MSVQKLLILGRGNFAVEVADLVNDIPGYSVAGFVENMEPERCRDGVEGLPLFWIDDIGRMANDHLAVCALGSTKRSGFIELVSGYGFRFATLVHPTASVSGSSYVGEGSIISPGVIVAAKTRIGRYVILNRGALIGHHTEVGDLTTVGPGANIAGSCMVGRSSFIGMGAIINDHITVGSGSVVGSGAVVTRNVPDNVQVVGIPARIVKEGIEGK
jgi:sugar O-acyltransferase (sialic acid O-acetyltransferase NeuD family)